MWPFKKKQIKENQKLKKVLKYKDPVDVKVGITSVYLKFLDNREFTTVVYGTVYQYVNRSDLEQGVGAVSITKSDNEASWFIQQCYNINIFVDDPTFPNKSISGQVISAEIGETVEEHTVKFQEAYVEEVKE